MLRRYNYKDKSTHHKKHKARSSSKRCRAISFERVDRSDNRLYSDTRRTLEHSSMDTKTDPFSKVGHRMPNHEKLPPAQSMISGILFDRILHSHHYLESMDLCPVIWIFALELRRTDTPPVSKSHFRTRHILDPIRDSRRIGDFDTSIGISLIKRAGKNERNQSFNVTLHRLPLIYSCRTESRVYKVFSCLSIQKPLIKRFF